MGDLVVAADQVWWLVPSEGREKINVDARQVAKGMSGLGAVCRDGSGGVLSCADVQVRAKWEAHTAEACAVMDGVLKARSLGLQRIIIEGDCLRPSLCVSFEKSREGIECFPFGFG